MKNKILREKNSKKYRKTENNEKKTFVLFTFLCGS